MDATERPLHVLLFPTRSGRPDSNRRPPAPKAGAIPGYATPRRSTGRYVILWSGGGQPGPANLCHYTADGGAGTIQARTDSNWSNAEKARPR